MILRKDIYSTEGTDIIERGMSYTTSSGDSNDTGIAWEYLTKHYIHMYTISSSSSSSSNSDSKKYENLLVQSSLKGIQAAKGKSRSGMNVNNLLNRLYCLLVSD